MSAEEITVSDIKTIQSPKNIKGKNPVWVNFGDKTVKYFNCPFYEQCLTKAADIDPPNWTCLYCNQAKEARISDLVIFRAKKSLSKDEINEIKKLEKSHHIKIRESADNY